MTKISLSSFHLFRIFHRHVGTVLYLLACTNVIIFVETGEINNFLICSLMKPLIQLTLFECLLFFIFHHLSQLFQNLLNLYHRQHSWFIGPVSKLRMRDIAEQLQSFNTVDIFAYRSNNPPHMFSSHKPNSIARSLAKSGINERYTVAVRLHHQQQLVDYVRRPRYHYRSWWFRFRFIPTVVTVWQYFSEPLLLINQSSNMHSLNLMGLNESLFGFIL